MKHIKIPFAIGIAFFLHSCSATSKLTVPSVREADLQKKYNYETGFNNADTINFIRIGHATTLINIGGKTILTDPWFSEKKGYYRGEPIAFLQDKLPLLSMVVVSHHHYDHFDIETFKTYPDKNVPFIVPVGVGKKVKSAGFSNVYEIDPWQSVTIDGVKVTACPAKHKVKEITFMIEAGNRAVYFGGDTKLIPELSEIKTRFPNIDLAILPVNGLKIRPMFNKQMVMSAVQAAEFCAIINPKVAVPIHYNFSGGKFKDLFILKYDGNAQEFANATTVNAPKTKTFILETGDTLFIH
ncbi:MBL fold metallo-hydrolase [Paenimyroides ceti]